MPVQDTVAQVESPTVIRSVRLRLLPERESVAHKLAVQAGACRKIWNPFLDKKTQDYHAYRCWQDFRIGPEKPKPNLSFYGMGTEFTKLRNSDPKYAWLQEYSYHEIRYVLKYLADAYRAFFAGGGHPCFKSKHHTRDGFTIAQNVKIAQGCLHVPKIGKLQLKGANPYAHCQPKQARVCKEGTATRPKWYVYITYEVPVAEVKQGAETGALGLDRNVGQAMDSQGQMYRMTDTKRLDAKIKRKQRVKERKQKGSKRGRRVAGQLRKLQRKRKRIRDHDTHPISRELADQAHTVVREDLNAAGMTQSAKGTVEEPGSNVKQKAGVNREILATGWHPLERKLMYKCGAVHKVDPKHTSQTCHQCGCVDKRNRVSQAIFHCVGCGLRMHADHNAAINILVRHARTVARGTGATARRVAFSLETTTTREQDIPAYSYAVY